MKKLKKIGLSILGFMTILANKITVHAVSIPLYGVPYESEPKEKVNILGIVKIFILPILFIIGLIVAIKNYLTFTNKKKEMKSKQGQKLYGPPSVMEQKSNNDNIELENLKNRLIVSIIALVSIGLLWIITAYII